MTIWAFLAQVLDPDGSCRQAVSRVIAHYAAVGLTPPSNHTGAYCRARGRLPEGVLVRLLRWSADRLQGSVEEPQRWLGRTVKIVDGSGVSMPDTPENQKAFPQPTSQAKGCGFPVLRLVALFGLETGAVLATAFASLKTGEIPLFRRLWSLLNAGDIVVGDRGFCSFANIAELQRRSVDEIFRVSASRRINFRNGKRLGRNDRLVIWERPRIRPRRLSIKEFRRLPESLAVRMLRFDVALRGFRCRQVILVTTLLETKEYPLEALANLYRQRWQSELWLRDLKISMQMDVLRGKTPDIVRKELYAHLLAYNLIRTMMWNAASRHGGNAMELSFKGSVQHVRTLAPFLAGAKASQRNELYGHLLHVLAQEKIPQRPNRFEPRLKKRRPKSYGWLQQPRRELKRLLATGVAVK